MVNADGSMICKVTGRRRDGDGDTIGGETRHLFGNEGRDDVTSKVVE
jgi:hypothetical protein